MTVRYGVWCEVDGNMGFREAWLKQDGGIVLFDTEKEAEAAAWDAYLGVSAHNTARFSYTAREFYE